MKNNKASKIIIGLLLLLVAYFVVKEVQNYQQKRELEIAVNEFRGIPNSDRERESMTMLKLGDLRTTAVLYQADNETLYAFCESFEYRDFASELSHIGASEPKCRVTRQGEDFIAYVQLNNEEYYCVTLDEQERLQNMLTGDSCTAI